MKKTLLTTLLGIFTLVGVTILPNISDAADGTNWASPNATANLIGDGNQTLTGSSLLDTIKNAINWCMGILATVALAICLYGGFMMVVSAGDNGKYQNGLKVLKNAAIGLAIIGLSWMIVSAVFRAIGTLGGGKQTKSAGTENIQSNEGSLIDDTTNSTRPLNPNNGPIPIQTDPVRIIR